jgi:hypothetical protein
MIGGNVKIGDLRKERNIVRIFDTEGRNSGKYFTLNPGNELVGFTQDHIVIIFTGLNVARIYDSNGRDTGRYISLGSDKYIKGVSQTVILVKERNITKYYDFSGRYTGKYITN